jgi:hypothetical protein
VQPALLEAGLAAPGIDLPPWTLDAGDEDPMLALLPGQTLVRLAAADSLRRAGSGDPAAALEAALLGMRVGWKLSTAAEPQLVGMMLGVGAQRTSLAALERLLPQLSLSARQARELAGRLDGWRWPEGAWRAAWRAEYRFVRNATGQVASGEMAEEDLFPRDSPGVLQLPWWLPRDYRFQPNRTLSRAADMFRELGAWSEKPCAANAASAGEDDLGALDVFRPNGAGRIALGIARPNFTHFDRRRCQHATRISLVQALLALHTYRGEHGTLPDTLEALVPDHLDAVPEDRFDGQPIRWSREQATLYSVGDDFVDDGPPEAPSQRDERAPAIRLPDRPIPTPAPTAS